MEAITEMIKDWHPTDMLHSKGHRPIQVKRLSELRTTAEGTTDTLVYWQVLTSPRYANRTGIHLITMVPETRLRPIVKKEPQSKEATTTEAWDAYKRIEPRYSDSNRKLADL